MPSVNGYEHLLAGAGAGIITTLTLHPLDLVKIRFQVQDGKNAASAASAAASASTPARPRYDGLRHAFSTIWRTEGPAALHKGVMANALGSGMAWGSYFFGYEFLKGKLRAEGQQGPLAPTQHMAAALAAGIGTLLLTNPIWVVKTRWCLQVEHVDAAAGGKGQTQYRSVGQALASIWRHEGLRGLYKGLGPGLLATSHGAIQFMVYEELKKWRNEHSGREAAAKLQTTDYILTAGVSKTCAVTATYPLQVLRSRLQDVHADSSRAVAVAQRLWAADGARAFYRGLLANLIRVMPATCLTFVAYENLHRALRSDEDEDGGAG